MDGKPSPAPAQAPGWKRTPGSLSSYLEAKDRSGLTALAWAAQKGYVEIAESLVDHGSDVEVRDGFGRTPLMTAAAEGHTQVVQFLAQMSQLNSQDHDGRTALALAAGRGRFDAAQALIDCQVDLEVPDKLGYRALTWAAIAGNLSIVELLLDKECELEAKDLQGLTPLVLAAMQGHDAVAHRIAAEGARVPLDLRDRYTQLKPVGRPPKQLQAPAQKQQPATELGATGSVATEVTAGAETDAIGGAEETGQDVEALRKAFDKFDKNQDGAISVMEFAKMLVRIPGEAPPFSAISKFFYDSDTDESCAIEFDEFVRVAAALNSGKVEGIPAIDIAEVSEKLQVDEAVEVEPQDDSHPPRVDTP